MGHFVTILLSNSAFSFGCYTQNIVE